ncbi:hypothetical protein MNBD_PLANCTO02-3124, partial [hydrothermal vent metagenome]
AEQIQTARDRKLEEARAKRKQRNQQKQNEKLIDNKTMLQCS